MTGVYLAHALSAKDIPFTWSDLDAAVCAWKASTGCVYPSGNSMDQSAYHMWRLGAPFQPELIAAAPFWYNTRNAPDGGKDAPAETKDDLHRHHLPSIHLNVQRFVEGGRKVYAANRWIGDWTNAPLDATRVVAHGFGARLHHYVWGWSRKVRLYYNPEHFGERACFYLKRGRFLTAYAYPVPGEDAWYAGSAMVAQQQPHQNDAYRWYARWLEYFLSWSHHLVDVEPVEEPRQGWRPKPARGDDAWVRWIDGKLHVKPQGSNGVRHAPYVASAVVEELTRAS